MFTSGHPVYKFPRKVLMKWFFLGLALLSQSLFCQGSEPIRRIVAFYNLENLFDTIDHPETYDEDYTPSGKLNYTGADYRRKLRKLSSVICDIGRFGRNSGPHILGVSEVENRQVLQALISQPALDSLPYAIAHMESPDLRGIDVALIYREDLFFPLSYESFEVRLWDDSGQRVFTRDVLWMHGILDAEEIHLLVNHWPSRRGGASRSSPKRLKAAYVNKQIVEQIKRENPNPKILILGDFNDDPTDKSLVEGLGAQSLKQLDSSGFFSPMIRLYKRGYNTLAYRDQIHLFDQILLSRNFVESDSGNGFRFARAGIYNPTRLHVREGKYKGYPFRSFQNGKYAGGFSDHFPVFVELIKE